MSETLLPRLELKSIEDIFRLVDEIKAEEVKAAKGVLAARTRIRVKLSSIAKLCRIARRDLLSKGKTMEKYGVDTRRDGDEKEAADDKKCPSCGAVVETHGDVKKCPVHGSEPFEKKDEEE